MKFVHSLWTETPQFSARYDHLVIHTLSQCLGNRHFHHTELVTDRRGLELAQTLGWRYTSYLNALNGIADEGTRHIWALGKLRALLAQESDFIHVDNDVLLLHSLPERLRRARLVAQSVDDQRHYRSESILSAMSVAGLDAREVAFNCGLIGGCDLRLLHAFAREAVAMAERFRGCQLNGTSTSMAIEQIHLGAFARRHGARIEVISSIHPNDEECQKSGYIHLCGAAKRDPRWVKKAEERMQREFPEEWRRFQEGWRWLNSEPKPGIAHFSDGVYVSR